MNLSATSALTFPASRPLSPADRLARVLANVTARPLYAFAILLVTSLAVYAPVLHGQLLWDDLYLVGDNPFFKSPIFSLEVFRHYLFVDSPSSYYRPVQNLSYMLDYLVWNGAPVGYHLSNVLIHCAAGFLLYCLLRQLLPVAVGPRGAREEPVASERWVDAAAFLVALVWTVHPIHNAGVAYISGRADSLATLFVAAAWLCYLKAGRDGRPLPAWTWGASACLLYLLALGSKEIAGIWLPLFALFALFFDRKKTARHRLIGVACAVAVVGCYLVLRSLPTATGEMPYNPPPSIPIRCLLALRAVGDYASLILFPANLRMDRMLLLPPRAMAAASDFTILRYELLGAAGVAAIIGAVLACVSARPGRQVRRFGALWFLIGFLPISNLFPLNAQSAEHWIYMASIGALVFLAGCALMLPRRLRGWVSAVVVLFACALGARTAIRSADWTEPTRFFARTAAAGGDSARVQLNFALTFFQKGDLEEAEKLLRETVTNHPGYAHSRISLGIVLFRAGKFEEAESFLNYDAATAEWMQKQCPYFWTSEIHLAWMRIAQGREEEALAVVNHALLRRPRLWNLIECKARIVEATQGRKAAISLVRDYVETHWWHSGANTLLAELLQKNGEPDAAITVLHRVSKFDIHKGEAFAKIAKIEYARGALADACAAQRQAVRREPSVPSRHLTLAAMLREAGHDAEARTELALGDALRADVEPPAIAAGS